MLLNFTASGAIATCYTMERNWLQHAASPNGPWHHVPGSDFVADADLMYNNNRTNITISSDEPELHYSINGKTATCRCNAAAQCLFGGSSSGGPANYPSLTASYRKDNYCNTAGILTEEQWLNLWAECTGCAAIEETWKLNDSRAEPINRMICDVDLYAWASETPNNSWGNNTELNVKCGTSSFRAQLRASGNGDYWEVSYDYLDTQGTRHNDGFDTTGQSNRLSLSYGVQVLNTVSNGENVNMEARVENPTSADSYLLKTDATNNLSGGNQLEDHHDSGYAKVELISIQAGP